MWYWLTLIAGFALIAVAIADVIWSTVSINGGGPISNKVSVVCWKVSRAIFVRTSSHWFLEWTTVAILVLTFLAWVVPMWLGWTLIFSAGEEVVIHQLSEEPAGLLDRAYFAGMVYLTLGTGDLMAASEGWRMWSMVASFTGIVTITLTISYLVSVVSAAIEKRHLASLIWVAGKSPEQVVINGWDGERFSILDDRLYELGQRLMLHSERHLAYPVLQYFHPRDPRAALPPGLAILEDAAIILGECVGEEARPSSTTLRLLRQAIDLYVDRVQLEHISKVDEAPQPPELSELREAGIPVREPDEVPSIFEPHTERRQLLWGLVIAEGWHWPRQPCRERSRED